MKNYRSILGVSADATLKEIVAAYRKLLKVSHPDRFDPATQQDEWREANRITRDLNEAYNHFKSKAARADAVEPDEHPENPSAERADAPTLGVRRRWKLSPAVALSVVGFSAAVVGLGFVVKSLASLLDRAPVATERREGASPVPLPKTGEERSHASGDAIAPLRISVPDDGTNYLVKVVDATTGKEVKDVFLRSGGFAEVKVPLGDYRLRYALGAAWYGRDRLFGEATRVVSVERVFSFRADSKGVRGYSVDLSSRTGGDLGATSVGADKF